MPDDATLIEAMAKAIWEDCSGWFDPRYQVTEADLKDTACCALAAYRDAVAGEALDIGADCD